MKVNGYEIKPFANLKGADLKGADLRCAESILKDANVTGTILEKKEESQDDKDLKIQQLEEENKKLKDALKALLDG